MESLQLDQHAEDKLIKLLGDRYDKNSGKITLKTDVCPLKKQNTDYAFYLLTALYFESWVRYNGFFAVLIDLMVTVVDFKYMEV